MKGVILVPTEPLSEEAKEKIKLLSENKKIVLEKLKKEHNL